MVERSRVPALCRVAVRAIGNGEGRACSRMHGIVGLLPSGQVASRVAAIRSRDIQAVIAIDVA